MARPRIPAKVVYAATALCLATFAVGYVVAAATVTNTSGSSNGNYIVEGSIPWWTLPSANPSTITLVPSPAPTSANATVATPTRLGELAQGYMVNTGTAGDIAQGFKFTEATSAPVNTEIEIAFVVNLGSGTISETVYLETQATAPASALTFTLYVDVGSAASATVTINYAEEISQVCSSVGSCP